MSMARVPGGTFKVENNMLVFEAEENSAGIDEFNSQRTQKFKEAADLLNNQLQDPDITFVGVCASTDRVFVAVNFPSISNMSGEVYEISVQHPEIFLTLADQKNFNNQNILLSSFKRGTKILKICCSGQENAVVLLEDSKKRYVYIRFLLLNTSSTPFQHEKHPHTWRMYTANWIQHPVMYQGEEKNVKDIECHENSCFEFRNE